MSILSKDQVERIKLAQVDHQAASHELVATCRLLFQPGTRIYWRTRGYPQSGNVIHWHGTAAYPSMRVENEHTGKTPDIFLHDIDWDRMLSQAASYEKEFKALEGKQ